MHYLNIDSYDEITASKRLLEKVGLEGYQVFFIISQI
jgi:hypothetical protein